MTDPNPATKHLYWRRPTDEGVVLPENKPQKIDPAAAPEASPASAVGSSWNSAGTWEEKNMGSAAREELEKIFCEESFVLFSKDGAQVSCSKASVSGDCNAYHIRGRPRLGFEFKVKISWKGTFDGESVSGELEIQDLDSSDLDGVDIRATTKADGAAKKAAEALKKGAKPAIKQAAELLSQRLLGA
eukprot:TRINITY_DN3942_c2_g6_i1.p1 TRINITY_DN3942_c2_g6~~TRINITY_DN3942_c2_g6_i1.p1  ORF type:complete len:187 (+),score=54.30 TRINITY_DN3942_c2_g6_i1:107-667(+)